MIWQHSFLAAPELYKDLIDCCHGFFYKMKQQISLKHSVGLLLPTSFAYIINALFNVSTLYQNMNRDSTIAVSKFSHLQAHCTARSHLSPCSEYEKSSTYINKHKDRRMFATSHSWTIKPVHKVQQRTTAAGIRLYILFVYIIYILRFLLHFENLVL